MKNSLDNWKTWWVSNVLLCHHLGGDRNQRDKYKNHKYYEDALNFCEEGDQVSFDPNFKSLNHKDFEPIIRNIFSIKPHTS